MAKFKIKTFDADCEQITMVDESSAPGSLSPLLKRSSFKVFVRDPGGISRGRFYCLEPEDLSSMNSHLTCIEIGNSPVVVLPSGQLEYVVEVLDDECPCPGSAAF